MRHVKNRQTKRWDCHTQLELILGPLKLLNITREILNMLAAQ
jgi:hypothetical protein